MKIAVLSDIHGNLPALEVVMAHIDQSRPDQVVVNGDVVNRGPQPAECWQCIRERLTRDGWLMTRGNHEEYVAAWAVPRPELTQAEQDLFRSSRWAYHQLHGDVAAFGRLPDRISLTAPDNGEIRITHASMLGNSNGFLPWHTDEQIRPKIAPPPDVFVTGHTHRFFVRQIDDTLLVNAGSVGCPLDGNSHTGYAELIWHNDAWQANLIRLPYDRDATYHHFTESGFLDEAGPSGLLMYLEWLDALPHMPGWGRAYGDKVQTGQITAHDSVAAYLDSIGRTVEL